MNAPAVFALLESRQADGQATATPRKESLVAGIAGRVVYYGLRDRRHTLVRADSEQPCDHLLRAASQYTMSPEPPEP